MEEVAAGRAEGEGTESNDGLAWVWRDGKLRREMPPPPPENAPVVVDVGPGLELPSWRRAERCCCGADTETVVAHREYLLAAGLNVGHLPYCPLHTLKEGS